MDCKRCEELKKMLIECSSLDAQVTVPERDYSTMTPKDIYEAGLMDGGMGVRDAIRTMLWDERILGCDEALRSLSSPSATAATAKSRSIFEHYAAAQGLHDFERNEFDGYRNPSTEGRWTYWQAAQAAMLAAAPAPALPVAWIGTRLSPDGGVDHQTANLSKVELVNRGYHESEIRPLVYAAPTSPVVEAEAIPQEVVKQQEALMHPATQVFFRAGLLACREYMARFVEPQDAGIAASIRANWWPSLGQDFGPPRLNDWSEFTEGEYGTDSFRCKTADEVSPTQEALPIAAQFLEACRSSSMKPSEGGK